MGGIGIPGVGDMLYSQVRGRPGIEQADPLELPKQRFKRGRVYEPVCLTTPFAGKSWCFRDYARGISHLPLRRMKAIFYDNSCKKEFTRKLLDFGKAHFADFTLLIDKTPPQTIESTTDYAKISWRCHQIYRTLQEHLDESEYMFNVEDDVELPPDTYKKLLGAFNMSPRVGTVVGSVCGRRLKDRGFKVPVVWKYTVTHTYPQNGTQVRDSRIMEERPFGLETVGGTHMACWMTKTALIKKIGFKWYEDGLQANDQVWGYRLNKAGYFPVIDWSIKCKHYWKVNGKKGWN